MERRKHRGLVVVGFLMSLIGFVAHGVASYLPYWYSQSGAGYSYHGGLWQFCYKESDDDDLTCKDVKNLWKDGVPWYQRACQGLAIGATLLTLIGIIIIIVKLCKGTEPGWKKAYPVSRVLFFVGGLMIFGVTGLWTGNHEKYVRENKSFAYWIEIGAGFLLIVSAILLAIRKYAPSDPYRTPTAQSHPSMTPAAQSHPSMTPSAQSYPNTMPTPQSYPNTMPTPQLYPNTTPAAQPYQYMPPPVQAYPYMANQGFARY
ncbi:unnamed protein product [Mytilus edulis]|uniref:Claudin n=2 Tax=Mytilus TaxID=6548 RepID=A0A8S3VEJ0_MYTED|nr:unnamed protein product [Mytilus edulis]